MNKNKLNISMNDFEIENNNESIKIEKILKNIKCDGKFIVYYRLYDKDVPEKCKNKIYFMDVESFYNFVVTKFEKYEGNIEYSHTEISKNSLIVSGEYTVKNIDRFHIRLEIFGIGKKSSKDLKNKISKKFLEIKIEEK